MRAMILAAGRGERMGVLTERRPKPLLDVDGRPLIEHHVVGLVRCGIERLVVNVSYLGTQIRDYLGTGDRWGITIDYSDEGEPPLETAGGIIRALPLLGSAPFILMNADVFTDFDCRALVQARQPGLVLVPNPAHHEEGDFGLDSDGWVSDEPPRLTYAGIALLDPATFTGLPDGRRPLKPLLDAAIARRELKGYVHKGLWIDVGTPERLDAARAAARRR